MKHSTSRDIWTLLMPSALSGFVAGLLSVGVVVGTIAITLYKGSGLAVELFRAKQSGTLPGYNFQVITDNLAHNHIISNLPLFLFWAVLGMIVYMFAIGMWQALSNAVELEHEFGYVNAPRTKLVRTVVVHMVVRAMVLAVWLGYVHIFLWLLLPYALGLAHIAAADLGSFLGIVGAVFAALVLFVAIQVQVVFLRLVLLRLRAFGSTLYN